MFCVSKKTTWAGQLAVAFLSAIRDINLGNLLARHAVRRVALVCALVCDARMSVDALVDTGHPEKTSLLDNYGSTGWPGYMAGGGGSGDCGASSSMMGSASASGMGLSSRCSPGSYRLNEAGCRHAPMGSKNWLKAERRLPFASVSSQPSFDAAAPIIVQVTVR